MYCHLPADESKNEPRILTRESAARLFRCRKMVIAGPDLAASILKCLPAIDDDGIDLPFAEIDFDLEGAEEQRLLLFNFFDVSFQQFNDPRDIPAGLIIFACLQRKLGFSHGISLVGRSLECRSRLAFQMPACAVQQTERRKRSCRLQIGIETGLSRSSDITRIDTDPGHSDQ
jgi:hypothetical protein